MRRLVHILTPGDHFSPSTGSAIPTVVHGLSRYAPTDQPRPAVAVARETYPDRYDSADIIEYDLARPLRVPIGRLERYLDGALSAASLPRWAVRRTLAPTVASQATWEPSIVLVHNAPQLLPQVDQHPAVLYAHNHLLRTYRASEVRRVLGGSAAIICVSDSLANQTEGRLPPSLRGRLRVVRNGVDANAFRRSGPLERTGRLKVLFVGRMIPEKGADVLVEAVRRLDREDVQLTLIGSSGFDAGSRLTDYEQMLRAAVHVLGDRVEIRPFVPRSQVMALLQQADVAVVPSRWPDPCPLTVLEGMAAGAAVVGSDIGGIPESLKGVGLLVPPNRPDDLAGALEALADDEGLRQHIARSCESYAAAHDWAWASARLYRTLEDTVG